jgi:hypothetical protein
MLKPEISPTCKKNCLTLAPMVIVYDVYGMVFYNAGTGRIQ